MPDFVYVIELEPVVRTQDAWQRKNAKQVTEECFYVGQTTHSPECRFKQHVTQRGEPCICVCEKKRGREVLRYAVGGAKWAKDHSVRLRPDLYEHLNPLKPGQDPKQAEKELAQSLRDLGHGAYSK